MKGDIGNLMRQAQEAMTKMQAAQDEVAQIEVDGESGGGMVKVIMNGKHELKKITIDDSLLAEDRDMLEDLIAAAVNNAVAKVTQESQSRMSSVTAGMPIPPGFKL
ncbi:Nucleoid-associated protein YaaK [hydrothermal vent metagenome]|uniref:Nucleoid-associated protein YaaK n=1 Tax=hydrothermal vent metagenome TaxID=652676 RepID=A0A3B0ZBW8_9ZZZZ